jgi:hypothetical protein
MEDAFLNGVVKLGKPGYDGLGDVDRRGKDQLPLVVAVFSLGGAEFVQ